MNPLLVDGKNGYWNAFFCLVLLNLQSCAFCQGWMLQPQILERQRHLAFQVPVISQTTTGAFQRRTTTLLTIQATKDEGQNGDLPNVQVINTLEEGKDDYETVEYDFLTEEEFKDSEWLVSTARYNATGGIYDDGITETKVRLETNAKGKMVARWADKAQGDWYFDRARQYLCISKENWVSRTLWVCTVEDYYYLEGPVQGWTLWSPASVLGQWQAIRLGIDEKDAGPAPWFQEDTENSINGTAAESNETHTTS